MNKESDKYKERLLENNKIKSILYKSGNDLALEVNKLLGKILDYDLSNFNYVFEEDCLIKLDDITYVVETKGLNNEVAGTDVTKAFNHEVIYEDKLESEKKEENVKCLFIVASERKKKVSDRKKINERQIKIAKRNDTLIIPTQILLEMYNDFINKNISREEIKSIFLKQNGLIKYEPKDNLYN